MDRTWVAEPGETVVEVEASGVNFGDIKHIAGELTDGPYAPEGHLPHILGMEVVGRTGAGRRVLGYVRQGGYAARTVVAERDLVELPQEVSAGQALALLVQGLTAWHLLRSVARVRPGESVVVHAAAGGTGSLVSPCAPSWLEAHPPACLRAGFRACRTACEPRRLTGGQRILQVLRRRYW